MSCNNMMDVIRQRNSPTEIYNAVHETENMERKSAKHLQTISIWDI